MAVAATTVRAPEAPHADGRRSVDPSLAAAVPSAIKSAGTISIGTDSTYAPNEFLDTDGKTVIGMDVDLFNAVAAKLGLKTQWQSAKFDSIIPGVTSGKYNIGVSSFTINSEREAQVTMVSYFSAGTQWGQKAGGSVNPNAACGKKVAVQTGTVQVDDLMSRSQKCVAAGQPAIKIDQFQAQSDATAAVVSGKDDAMIADSPVVAYAVKQTNGQLTLLGNIYESAPYGYVLPKDQTAFGAAIARRGQAAHRRRYVQQDPDEVGRAGRRDHQPDGQPEDLTGPWTSIPGQPSQG